MPRGEAVSTKASPAGGFRWRYGPCPGPSAARSVRSARPSPRRSARDPFGRRRDAGQGPLDEGAAVGRRIDAQRAVAHVDSGSWPRGLLDAPSVQAAGIVEPFFPDEAPHLRWIGLSQRRFIGGDDNQPALERSDGYSLLGLPAGLGLEVLDGRSVEHRLDGIDPQRFPVDFQTHARNLFRPAADRHERLARFHISRGQYVVAVRADGAVFLPVPDHPCFGDAEFVPGFPDGAWILRTFGSRPGASWCHAVDHAEPAVSPAV